MVVNKVTRVLTIILVQVYNKVDPLTQRLFFCVKGENKLICFVALGGVRHFLYEGEEIWKQESQ